MSQCLSVWWLKDPDQAAPESWPGDKRRGEHVLVPGIGWLLKGWWGETSGLKIIMGHVPLGPGMDPKTLFSVWLNSQKYLVSELTYIFSLTYNTNFFLFLSSGNLFLVLEIHICLNFLSGLFTPHLKGLGSCLDDAGILITNNFLLIYLFNKITTII